MVKKEKYLILLLSVLIIVVDQFTKMLVKKLELGKTIQLIPDFFNITYIHNYGAGFGTFQNWGFVLILISFVALGFSIYFFFKLKDNIILYLDALLIGGILGNLIDRLAYGYVIDFLDFIIWPIFNVADMMITTSIFLLIIYLWFKK
ncbi:signal peptidase II [Candidatus Woesearchaeota archaeon]|nr:signal peptidase II [Candidatus Woesearchaeota archaeon]